MLRWWLEYGLRDDHGLSLGDASAWALLFYHCARVAEPGRESAPFLTWPEGNGRLVRHLADRVGAARIRLRHGATRVRREEDGAVLELVDAATDEAVEVRARHVVVALPRMIASRLVDGAPSSADATYGPWMVANLHLSRRPFERSYPLCWDNVLYDSPSLGYVVATHQSGRDHGPTVFTYYYALTESDADAGRRRLYEHPWDQWADAVLTDLRRAHRDVDRWVERIDVWRWGHAMVQPRVGSFTSQARRAAAEPLGPIHFAHSDLSGVALFEEAFDHGVRAADAILAARRAG
jgi:protoporphyrinogen oxidase